MTVFRQSIRFVVSKKPIAGFVTKFGGQPVWFTEPQWPISAQTGRPMRFIAQIAIDPVVFGDLPCKMAYLFMTDEDDFVDGTWEPEGGENAVILQPGVPSAPTQPLREGPTLYQLVKKLFRTRLSKETCEFAIDISVSEDPMFASEAEQSQWADEKAAKYAAQLGGNKIGGTPVFIQGDEFPDGDSWQLLLQLDSTNVPFSVNFGDGGVGYAFLSADGTQAKFLWQCH